MTRFFYLACAVLILDQATKLLAEIFLASSPSFPVIPGIFHLTLVHNRGAAFGVFKGANILFILTSFFFIILIVVLLNRRELFLRFFSLDPQNSAVRFALGLILGGACGNLIDRLRFSYVVDFLDFRIWPVFNFADSAITIGGILIGYKLLMNTRMKSH